MEVNNDDMKQEGLYALCKAALTFDSNKEIKFSTYAGKCIFNQIGYILRKKITPDDITVVSLAQEIFNDESITLADTILDEKVDVERAAISMTALKEKYKSLSERLRKIAYYLSLDMKQEEIKKLLNLSQAQVSRNIKQLREILVSGVDKNDSVS
jgi:RNA polymerase sporulation-specific sigma factor